MKNHKIVAIRTADEYYKADTHGVEEITYDERGPFMWSGPAFRVAMKPITEMDDVPRLDIWVPLALVTEVKVYRS